MKTIIVQTTCHTKKEAKKISKELIKIKLSACIQIKKIKSFYTWNSVFCKENEYILTIKTCKKHFKKIKSTIQKLNSYKLPEIIQIKIKVLNKKYLKFIKDNTK